MLWLRLSNFVLLGIELASKGNFCIESAWWASPVCLPCSMRVLLMKRYCYCPWPSCGCLASAQPETDTGAYWYRYPAQLVHVGLALATEQVLLHKDNLSASNR
jgi:hypothetical protein